MRNMSDSNDGNRKIKFRCGSPASPALVQVGLDLVLNPVDQAHHVSRLSGRNLFCQVFPHGADAAKGKHYVVSSVSGQQGMKTFQNNKETSDIQQITTIKREVIGD